MDNEEDDILVGSVSTSRSSSAPQTPHHHSSSSINKRKSFGKGILGDEDKDEDIKSRHDELRRRRALQQPSSSVNTESLGDGWITRASRLKKLKTGEMVGSGKSKSITRQDEDNDGQQVQLDADELEKALEDVKRKRGLDNDGVFRKVGLERKRYIQEDKTLANPSPTIHSSLSTVFLLLACSST